MNVKGATVAKRVVADGVLDQQGVYPVVKITGGTSLVLGTGVAIGSRWILTASHLFRGPHLRVRVKSWCGRDDVAVSAIHWQDISYVFPSRTQVGEPPSWPGSVGDLRGERDQPVLLELEEDLGLANYAQLGGGYRTGEELRIVGYGIDSTGNYNADEIATIARMVGVDAAQSQFGRCRSDPRVAPDEDMPRHDDSGAPVFKADTLNVIGIHSSRDWSRLAGAPQETETAQFILITGSIRDWAIGHVQQGSRESPDAARRPRRFVLRRLHACLTLTGGEKSLDGTWHLSVPSGNPSVLRLCDRIQIANGEFRLYRCNAKVPVYQCKVRLGGDGQVPDAWLHGVDKPGSNRVEFYIFRRSDGLLPVAPSSGTIQYEIKRRLHVEVFKGDSPHDTPDGNLELGGAVLDPLEMPRCTGCLSSGKLLAKVDDQDDEGDAYEG